MFLAKKTLEFQSEDMRDDISSPKSTSFREEEDKSDHKQSTQPNDTDRFISYRPLTKKNENDCEMKSHNGGDYLSARDDQIFLAERFDQAKTELPQKNQENADKFTDPVSTNHKSHLLPILDIQNHLYKTQKDSASENITEKLKIFESQAEKMENFQEDYLKLFTPLKNVSKDVFRTYWEENATSLESKCQYVYCTHFSHSILYPIFALLIVYPSLLYEPHFRIYSRFVQTEKEEQEVINNLSTPNAKKNSVSKSSTPFNLPNSSKQEIISRNFELNTCLGLSSSKDSPCQRINFYSAEEIIKIQPTQELISNLSLHSASTSPAKFDEECNYLLEKKRKATLISAVLGWSDLTSKRIHYSKLISLNSPYLRNMRFYYKFKENNASLFPKESNICWRASDSMVLGECIKAIDQHQIFLREFQSMTKKSLKKPNQPRFRKPRKPKSQTNEKTLKSLTEKLKQSFLLLLNEIKSKIPNPFEEKFEDTELILNCIFPQQINVEQHKKPSNQKDGLANQENYTLNKEENEEKSPVAWFKYFEERINICCRNCILSLKFLIIP
jgi:hypothetical protein